MISLTAIAAFAAIVSAVIFGWQLHVMNRQLDAMQTQVRPWVEINSVFPNQEFNGITFVKNGDIGIVPSATVKNVGSAPAVGTELNARLIAYGEETYTGWLEILNNSTRYCQFMRAQTERLHEWGDDLIFPGEADTLITGDFDDLTIKGSYVQQHIFNAAGKKYIRLAVVGCVEYRIPYYSRILQTRFAYVIKLRSTNSGLIPMGNNLSPQDLIFERYQFGNGYAD